MPADFNRLNLLLSLRRYADGEKAAREAIAEDPETGTWYSFLALFLFNQGRAGEAVGPARTGVGKSPHDPWAHTVLSLVLERSGEGGARRAIREAIRLDPWYAFGHAQLAELLCDDQRYEEALEATLTGLKYAPEHESLLQWKGWSEYQLYRNADALATADEGLRLHPQSPQLHNLRGAVLQRRAEQALLPAVRRWGRLHRQAEAAFAEAVRLDPAYPGYQSNYHENAATYRRRILACLWIGLMAAATVVGVIGFVIAGHPSAGFGFGTLFVACGFFGYVGAGIIPRWLAISLPLGWLGVARLPLNEMERKDRRTTMLAAAVAAAFIGTFVLKAILDSK